MSEKKKTLREETRWTDAKINRWIIAHPNFLIKVVALGLDLGYWTVWRAIRRISKDRRKLDAKSSSSCKIIKL